METFLVKVQVSSATLVLEEVQIQSSFLSWDPLMINALFKLLAEQAIH